VLRSGNEFTDCAAAALVMDAHAEALRRLGE